MRNNNTNIIFSSWPSAGGTTAARFIALMFEMKYVYAGGVLKYWVKAMGYDPKSNQINEWAEKYHRYWDLVWENFIAKYALSSTNALVEGMTAGFMIQSDKVYKVFVKADLEVRMKRAQGDKRSESVGVRDAFLKNEWKERFGIDIFDEELIKRSYDFVLDATNIGIKEVWTSILQNLNENNVRNFNLSKYLKNVESVYAKYERNSDYLKDELEKKGLILESSQVLKIIKEQYPDLVAQIPEEMKSVI